MFGLLKRRGIADGQLGAIPDPRNPRAAASAAPLGPDPESIPLQARRVNAPNPFPAPDPTIGALMRFQYGSGDSPLDGYAIKRGIGVGGFGEVYFAESESGKEVALKRIQKNLDVEMRGVRHCLNLRHPNLVAIYDIKFDRDQQGWIVMEFIEGESLRECLDRYPQGMPADDILPLFSQIVAGTTYLHDQGIVHRDLKPANIFVENGLAKIGDYGLSKYISASRRGGQTESVGTFHYMAPEIGKGEYGKEIDIYSLGIILYEMLTGDVPFDGESTQEILLKHLTADPDLSRVPPRYAEVIGHALAKNPTSRYRDGRDLLRALGYELTTGGLPSKTYDYDSLWSGNETNDAFASANLFGTHPDAAGPAVAATTYRGATTAADASKPTAAQPSQQPQHQAHRTPFGPSTDTPLNFGERYAAFFTIGLPGHQRMLQREPIAKWILKTWDELQFKYQSTTQGGRGIVLIVLLIALFFNLSILTAIAFPLAWAYAIYYVAWFLNSVTRADLQPPPRSQPRSQPSPQHAPNQRVQYVQSKIVPAASQPAPFGLQETVHYKTNSNARPVVASVTSKPLSSRQALRAWQQSQREQMQQRGAWTAFHAWTRSLWIAGFVIAVITAGGGYLAMAKESLSRTDGTSGLAWLGIMSALTSWTILSLTRRWESRGEDSLAFRFTLMVFGLLLGAASYQLSEYLLIPWNQITRGQGVLIGVPFDNGTNNVLNRSWGGFYDANGVPMLAGHMAYFAGLLWSVRWWRQADTLRRKRFSLWPVLWSVVLAGLVQGVFYFPTPWCLMLGGLTSFAIQIASPWIEPHSPSPVA